MKKIFLVSLFALFSVFAFSQRTATMDTVQGAETISSAVMTGATSITAKCTQLGGTTDGTLTLYGSNDGTNYVFLNFVGAELGTASPKASITGADLNQVTMTSGLIANWTLKGEPFAYYKLTAVGTASDTTLVSVTYRK